MGARAEENPPRTMGSLDPQVRALPNRPYRATFPTGSPAGHPESGGRDVEMVATEALCWGSLLHGLSCSLPPWLPPRAPALISGPTWLRVSSVSEAESSKSLLPPLLYPTLSDGLSVPAFAGLQDTPKLDCTWC